MILDKFKKKKNEELLNSDLAGQMLQNVFDVCEVEPNSVPLDVLESYSNYRKDRFSLQRLILIIIMVLFIAVPLLFVAPKMTTKDKTTNISAPVYQMSVESILPIKSVTAVIDGANVPVYETEANVYSVEPTVGGAMTITVTSFNHQVATKTINVSTIDRQPPAVASDQTKDGVIYLHLEDKGSGVDYANIYGIDEAGDEILPVDYSETQGYVAFDYPSSSLNLYIPDKSENVLRLILTVR
ncbi:MAG: hypothetical protein GX663_09995 [Clostridiales bacterium]|nr:hypothetical protein [Clostridiales bacterium]